MFRQKFGDIGHMPAWWQNVRDVSFFMRRGGGSVDFHFGLQNIFLPPLLDALT